MQIEELQSALKKFENYYHKRRWEEEKLQEERESAIRRRRELVAEVDLLQQTRLLLQEASDFAREQARAQIEHMVTNALQFTFGEDISFRVEVQERRGQPDAEFYVVSKYGGAEVKNRPQDARGGGVVDVISLALRVALLQTSRPPLAGPLLLDEPAKHVSEEFAPNVARFLKSLSDMFGRQVVMVTHNQHLTEAADAVYVVEMREGKSLVKKISGA
ncbi:MAG: ATP-binding protein [Peptococcaceae bacterium]|nr:MAG: ATP-binding protein [Peptococcaceae bacterium]